MEQCAELLTKEYSDGLLTGALLVILVCIITAMAIEMVRR